MVREARGDLFIDLLFPRQRIIILALQYHPKLLTLLHFQHACTQEWPDRAHHGLLTDDKVSTVACAVRQMNKLNEQCQQDPELLITRFA